MDFYEEHGPNIHSGKPRHKVIARLVEGPAILDFGCGAGDLLVKIQEATTGWTLCGVDISQPALQYARERGFEGELQTSTGELTARQFDTIVAAQVIEHIEDDAKTIAELNNLLVQGGLLIVSVPFENQVPSPDHCRIYTRASLKALLLPIGGVEIVHWSGRRTRMIAMARKGKWKIPKELFNYGAIQI